MSNIIQLSKPCVFVIQGKRTAFCRADALRKLSGKHPDH
jgi:hypothetical protein